MTYYINKIIKADFDDAYELVINALKNEGFGVLSEIDIQEKMSEKLNVTFRKYKILGACNPPFAYEALQFEDKIGTLLPCNVILQELEEGLIEVAAVDPVASLSWINSKEITRIAKEVQVKLEKVIAEL